MHTASTCIHFGGGLLVVVDPCSVKIYAEAGFPGALTFAGGNMNIKKFANSTGGKT